MRMPCDGPPCTCGALKMKTGKGRFEAIPDLTPFDVETLRVCVGTVGDFEAYQDLVSSARRRRRGWANKAEPQADQAAYYLERLGLVDLAWDITPAGRAVLAALGVS